MTTKPNTDHQLLESLAHEATCSAGHPGEMNWQGEPPCQHAAAFSATIHACEPMAINADPLLCIGHLADIALTVNAELAKLGGQPLFCASCDAPIRSLGDLIWNIIPLHA